MPRSNVWRYGGNWSIASRLNPVCGQSFASVSWRGKRWGNTVISGITFDTIRAVLLKSHQLFGLDNLDKHLYAVNIDRNR